MAVIDSHAHLDPRMLALDAIVAKMDRAGIDKVALIPHMSDPLPHTPRALLALFRGLMTTPLHPTWAPWLWQWATQSGALQALESVGCRAWQGCVDETQLEEALSTALANGLLRIPSVASSS